MLKKKILPMYNKTMERLISASKFSKSEEAQFRLKVIEFSKVYGVKVAIEAFGVSRATIFRWRRCLKDSQGRLDSLIPKSRRPRRVRSMKVNSETVAFIRDIREKHPRISKEKIKKFLDEYCSKRGIKTVSVSTIGKIIKRYDLTFAPSKLNYHNPQSGWARRKVNYKSKVRHSPKSTEPGYIEIIPYLLGGTLLIAKRQQKFKFGSIDLLFIFFFFLIFLSYLMFSTENINAYVKITYAPLLAILPYFGIRLLTSAKAIKRFFDYCVLVAAILIIPAFYELFFNPIFTKSRTFSMYVFEGGKDNPILFGITFAILLIILFFFCSIFK